MSSVLDAERAVHQRVPPTLADIRSEGKLPQHVSAAYSKAGPHTWMWGVAGGRGVASRGGAIAGRGGRVA